MIKVNLLKDQTVKVPTKFTTPTVSRMGLIFLAIFLLAAGGMVGWYFYVGQQIKACTQKRKVLRAEEARLKELENEIQKYEELKQLRLSRIEIIEKLKENQKGPVLLLNNVIQSMPKDGLMWLTNLTQKKDLVKIAGFTRNTETIPDFMSNLAASGIFQTVDLELIESQKEQDSAKFSLLCTSLSRPKED